MKVSKNQLRTLISINLTDFQIILTDNSRKIYKNNSTIYPNKNPSLNNKTRRKNQFKTSSKAFTLISIKMQTYSRKSKRKLLPRYLVIKNLTNQIRCNKNLNMPMKHTMKT